jgi:hypothetical protein
MTNTVVPYMSPRSSRLKCFGAIFECTHMIDILLIYLVACFIEQQDYLCINYEKDSVKSESQAGAPFTH